MDKLFAVRTFLHSVTPEVTIQLKAVFSNKVTGITSQVSSRTVPVIHAVVVSICVNVRRRNGIETIVVGRNHFLQDL